MNERPALPVARLDGLPRNVKVLGLASLVNDIASEMMYPILPEFVTKELGGSRFALGIIEGIAETVSSLLKLFAGGISDRLGSRKMFVVVGYALTAVSRPIAGTVLVPWQLLLTRLGDRIGKGIRTAPRDALIADSTHVSMRGRSFGFHRAMDHLGAAIGPILAMAFLFVCPNEYRWLFVATVLPGFAVVLLLLVGLRPAPVKTPLKEPLRLTLKPFSRDFKVYLLALLLFTLGNSSDMFLLLRAGELGVPIVFLPLLWFVFHVIKSIGSYFVGSLVDRFGARIMILLGWAVYAAIYLAFGLIIAAWQIWLFFLLYAVFYSLTEPAEKTMVATLVPPDKRGLAFGWFNFAIGIGALPSSVLFGWIYDQWGAMLAFSWGASLAGVAALILLTVKVQHTSQEGQPLPD